MTNILTAEKFDELKLWIGRKLEIHDVVTASALTRMSSLLDRSDPNPQPGDPVLPGWHILFLLAAVNPQKVAEEGGTPHASILPPNPFRREMWAGCRTIFLRSLRVGDEIKRVALLKSLTTKVGRNGPMLLLTVRDEISTSNGIAIIDEIDLIYRDPQPGEILPPSQTRPTSAMWSRAVRVDAPFLFLFSALTYNSHRIHYDYPYTTRHEGYPGLVAPGPLQALLILDLLRRHSSRPIAEFSSRAQRPIFADTTISVEGTSDFEDKSADFWICDAEGSLCMTANARFNGS